MSYINTYDQSNISFPWDIGLVSARAANGSVGDELQLRGWTHNGWQNSTLADFMGFRDVFVLNGHLIFSPNASQGQRGRFNTYDTNDDASYTFWGGSKLSTKLPALSRILWRGDLAFLYDAEMNVTPSRSRLDQYSMARGMTLSVWRARHEKLSMFLVNDRLVRSMDEVNYVEEIDAVLVRFVTPADPDLPSDFNTPLFLPRLQPVMEAGPKLLYTS